ncbi:MAG: capsular polysaccharide biosynthesis protein, partial [Epsilonproteobacteria bacterium]|nr:capsular polysaccharide biosynthesis protein [Campylobacterota bacterium]
GWGLTNDKFTSDRNNRVLGIDELIAGALILYPRYINPKTLAFCEVEVAFDEMLEMQKRYFEVAWFRMIVDVKTFILRKLRRTIEFVLEKVGKR